MDIFDVDIHDDRVKFIEAKPVGWADYLPVKLFREALLAEGVPPEQLPSAPGDNRCLERAMQDLRSTRNLVRPLPKSRGWSLVIEDANALDLEKREEAERLGTELEEPAHKVEITAKVERAEDDGQLSTLRITPEDHPAVPLIRQTFKFHRGTDDENQGMFKCSMDLSVWFSQTIIPWVNGVATRSRGGSYYVIRGQNLARLEKVCRALENASKYTTQNISLPDGNIIKRTKVTAGGRIILKPELGTAAAIEVLIDSVINECDKVCDDMDEKLRSEKLGVRALTSQVTRAERASEKLKEFEDLLGIGLNDTRARIGEVSAATGMARLKIEAEKDAKEAA
jgi:hypothetical protein